MAKKNKEQEDVVFTEEDDAVTETVAETVAETTPSGRARSKVLVSKTPQELGDLFGFETPILISRKDFLARVSKLESADLATKYGV